MKDEIIKGNLKNGVATIIYQFLQRSECRDQSISEKLSVMNIENIRFLQTTIDLSSRSAITGDSFHKAQDVGCLQHKWIATVVSLSQHFVSGSDPKRMYYGSLDMRHDEFSEYHLANLPPTYLPSGFMFFLLTIF